MKMLKKWALLFHVALLLLLVNGAQAQTESAGTQTITETAVIEPEVEMADKLRADGKIYIVIVCVLAVLLGMIIYLVALDKKVSRLEKQYKS